MSANSTLLANLLLKVQDDLGSGGSPLNITVPQFSYDAKSVVYAGYLSLAPGTNLNIVPDGTLCGFLYVRNATPNVQQVANAVMSVAIKIDATLQDVVLIAGGFMMIGNPINANPEATMTDISFLIGAGIPVVVEYLYALQP